VEGTLAVPDERLRQPAEQSEAAGDPVEEVGRLLREDERAGADARVGQAADDDVAAAQLAAADRDLRARLPEVELAERARPVLRALEAARAGQEERPHLAQVVVEDRLAALEALLFDQLPDPLAGQARLGAEQAVDLLLERVELGGAGWARVPRRPLGAERPADRVAIAPRAAGDLLDWQPLDEVQAADLGPLLHPDHDLLLARSARPSEARHPTGRRRAARPGVRFRPASGGEY
jgi:hypothetical protein